MTIFTFADRVRVSTSTTGTGTINLGNGVSGFRTFAQAVVDGALVSGANVYYCIEDGASWEVGSGVYTAGSPDTLSRSVLQSSAAGSALNLSGSAQVFITASAAVFNALDGSSGIIATNSTASRALIDRAADVINVKDFGAKGDNTTDDTAAINAAFAYARGTLLGTYQTRILFPPGIYVTTAPINLTGFGNTSDYFQDLVIDGYGATIHCKMAGSTAAVDMMGSRWVTINGLAIYGDPSTTPTFGLQLGRVTTLGASDMHKFNNVRVFGYFVTSAIYNFGSESNQWNTLYASNQQTGSAYAMILDAFNSFSVSSTFVTITAAANTIASMQENIFISANLANYSSTVAPVLVLQANAKTRFVSSCVITNNFTVGVTIDMTHNAGFPLCMFDADIHFEPYGGVQTAFLFKGATNQYVTSFRYAEEDGLISSYIFKLDTGVTNLTIGNLEIDAATWGGSSFPVVFDQPGQYNVSGNLKLPLAATWNQPASFVGNLFTGSGGGGETLRSSNYGINAGPPLFGTGADGALTISSGTTFLARDTHYTNLTISGSGHLDTNGYRLYVSGVLHLETAPSTAIFWNGANGGNASGATAGTTSYTIGTTVPGSVNSGAVNGGAGATGAGAAGATTVQSAYNSFGGGSGAGGAGGVGASGAAGAAGGGYAPGAIIPVAGTYDPLPILLYNVSVISSNGGGGGGGGGDGTHLGGGGGAGGSGGGAVWIWANIIARGTNSTASIIQSLGGNGGTGAAGAAANAAGGGGGGGGGGGHVFIVAGSMTGSTITNAIALDGGAGGAGGNGVGTGKGGNGGTGGATGHASIMVMNPPAFHETLGNTVGGTGATTATATGAAGGSATTLRVNL